MQWCDVQEDAYRGRSQSLESRKSKEPRRLTEKIAIMKRKEHEQSEAFEQAMRSIFEMQRARLHSGGGSMPSLLATDTVPSSEYPEPPAIDMQSVFRDLNEVKKSSYASERERTSRPLSGGGKRKNNFDPNPYPVIPSNSHYHWGMTSGEWMEGDLSRHKSDSDLQQSLLLQQQNDSLPCFSQPSPQSHKVPCGDINLWNTGKQKRPVSMTAGLLSPEQCLCQEEPHPMPLATAGETASSLPDLTNIEFSCGLDTPLERDEEQLLSSGRLGPYSSPPSKTHCPGPSKLIYSSLQAATAAHQSQSRLAHAPLPRYNTFSGQHLHTSSYSGVPASPFLPHGSGGLGGVRKSPTMPDFRTFSGDLSSDTFAATNSSQYHHSPSSLQPPPPPSLAQAQALSHGSSIAAPAPPVSILFLPPAGSSPSPATPPPCSGASGPSSKLPLGRIGEGASSLHPLSVHGSSKAQALGALWHAHSALPSYLQAREQQAMQDRFASISVHRQEALIRSHSEENLQKGQKEKGDLTQNPFMGNLANASSVPCVYVESTSAEPIQPQDRSESPAPGDSPSTSASYASSPPSIRPYWIDQPSTVDEFMFNEWPLEGLQSNRSKVDSPLSHHRSLTDLSTIPEVAELSPTTRSRFQLSLPSVVMSDLAVDQLEKQASPTFADFEMAEAALQELDMESLLTPASLSFMHKMS